MIRVEEGNGNSMRGKSSIVMRAFKTLQEEGIIVFSLKALSYIKLEPLILPYALLKIKNLNTNNLGELVNFAFNDIIGLIKPLQVQDEILELLRCLDEIKPKIVIEIGTANGGTLFLFSRVASEDATIISIDFPDRRFAGRYRKWKLPLYKAFRLVGQKLRLIIADSHSRETLERVENILNGGKIDFLFIDGDHTYEGVRKDFEMYSPLVKEEGIIAFHDIIVHPSESGCGVSKFWNEIKKEKYKYAEIVKNQNQGWGGIGLLFMRPER